MDDRKRFMLGFADRLRICCDESGMTRKQISEITGCSLTALYGYLAAEHEPTAYVILKFSKIFGISCDELIGVNDWED